MFVFLLSIGLDGCDVLVAARVVEVLALVSDELSWVTEASSNLLLALGTKRNTLAWVTNGVVVLAAVEVVGPAVVLRLPAAVFTPKLPFHVPKTFINSMPSQFVRDNWLVLMFTRLRLAVAFPL